MSSIIYILGIVFIIFIIFFAILLIVLILIIKTPTLRLLRARIAFKFLYSLNEEEYNNAIRFINEKRKNK